jgi:ketosteroid isomerase-like protein
MSARLPWTEALASWQPAAIVERLADDATIRVAVHDAPMQGREVAEFLFGVLSEELAPPRVTDEIVEGDSAVVLFETEVRGKAVQGLNVVRHAPDGRVADLTVFFRPLESLATIAEVVGARMAERFGPPPG